MAKVCAFVFIGIVRFRFSDNGNIVQTNNYNFMIKFKFLLSLLFFAVCFPCLSVAQTANNQTNTLELGTSVVLRVKEQFKAAGKAENGTINAVVDTDVLSADGSRVLVKAGTPAFIEFNAEMNGSWGKAGKVCLTSAVTRAINGKRVALRLSSCKKGRSRIGGVVTLSVLFCPLGLFSGFIKGGMPEISQGTTFSASVMQDVLCE